MRAHNPWILLALTLILPLLAGTPAAQAQLNANHYKCYEIINPPAVAFAVNLVDQFGVQNAQAVVPRYLCNPVHKNGSAVPNPNLHYVCYDIIVAPIPVKSVRVTNQFGTMDIQVQQAKLLCLPSSKILLP